MRIAGEILDHLRSANYTLGTNLRPTIMFLTMWSRATGSAYAQLICDGCTACPDSVPRNPGTPLSSGRIATCPGKVPEGVWVRPDSVPGDPRTPAPLLTANAGIPISMVPSVTAAMIVFRMIFPQAFVRFAASIVGAALLPP
jgi:hypothetical protein